MVFTTQNYGFMTCTSFSFVLAQLRELSRKIYRICSADPTRMFSCVSLKYMWLLGPNGFNGFSPVDARPEAWRAATRGAERGERGAGEREEKRREGRSVAFVPLVDGAPGRALASLGLRGSCRTRGLRPHPISACPVIDVDQLRWIPPPPPPPPDSTEIRS